MDSAATTTGHDPERATATMLDQAMRLHQMGRLAEAEPLYLRWLQSNPGETSGTYFLAGLRHQQGSQAEAVTLFRQVLQRDPEHADAWLNLGACCKGLGDLGEAARCFERAIELRPSLAAAHFNLGVVLQALQRPADSLPRYERAIALRPDYAQAYNNQGSALAKLNRLPEALQSFDRALALMPDYAEAHTNRGSALSRLGQFDEALSSHQRALRCAPRYAEAHCNLGVAIQALKGPAEALPHFERAIALRADSAPAHRNRATALALLNRRAEAVEGFDRAVALAPDDAEAHNNRGNALYGLGRFPEALASYRRALQCEADSADAHCNVGAVLQLLRRPEDALPHFERAIALRPDFGQAHRNRGSALAGLNRLDEALQCFDRALQIIPADAETHTNRGNVFYSLGRLDEALSNYERALRHAPEHAPAHWNLSLAQLRLGRLSAAWAGHEYRWKLPRAQPYRHGSTPRWSGSQPIAGKRVLVWSEQGYGDTVQFCRYGPMLAAQGARVVLEVQPELKRLMSRLAGVSELLAQGQAVEPCAFQVPLLSLPLAFETRLETIPAQVPYLSADPAKVAQWRQRLGHASGKLLVGIACAGSVCHENDRNRSVPLELFAPLFGKVQLYLLQTELREDDEATLRNAPILDLRGALADFSDTAALIECLDLVISVDTAVVHLAGALGKPVWLLLSSNADWRWMLDRTDSPWYPRARLFRQQRLGDWGGVIDQLAQELDVYRATAPPQALSTTVDRPSAGNASAPAHERPQPGAAGRPETTGGDPIEMYRLAGVRYRRGEVSEAVALLRQVLEFEPSNADAWLNLGACLEGLGELDEAVQCFERAIEVQPSFVAAHFNLGVVLQALQRPSDALRCYDRAIGLQPDHAQAHNNRGGALAALERLEESLGSFDLALTLLPDYAEAHTNRGSALKGLGRLGEAVSSHQRALQCAPGHAEAHCNLGVALQELNGPADALPHFERAIALRPKFAAAHRNRGTALAKLDRPQEAVESFDRALALAPTDAEAHNNRGWTLARLGRIDEAVTCYRRALTHAPDRADVHWNVAIEELRLGRFAAAWPRYEYRWKRPKAPVYRHASLPRWHGAETVAGKRVLVWSEQGFGDTLHFCRYVPMLAALGAQVVLEVQPGLRSLMGSLAGVAQLPQPADAIEACDFQVPLLSLPLAFGTELHTIPAQVPYLFADPAKVARWRQRLAEGSGAPRIGIAFSGNPAHENDRFRSMALRQLAPLYRKAQLYLLQKDASAEDEAELRQAPIQDPRADLEDFGDTAALIECLDLVICVDTAVAHLAGALGKPVWVLLSTDADWRWMLGRDDSPWYPSARLFRQTRLGEWPPTIDQVLQGVLSFSAQ